jgi:hypothetical protein
VRAPQVSAMTVVLDARVLAGVTGGADNETNIKTPNGTQINKSQSDREYAVEYATKACTEQNTRFFGLWRDDPTPCITNFMKQYDAGTGGTP